MNKFEKDLLVGEKGETIAKQFLLSSSHTRGFADARSDPYFQNLDIDYLVSRDDGKIVKYEVKTDTMAHRTGNIAFEMTTSGNVGCLAKSHADYILYYLSETNQMYFFNLETMKDYISSHTELEEVKMGDYATGFLLKINELKDRNILKEVNV